MLSAAIAIAYAFYVIASFPVGRNPVAILHDRTFTGVIAGQDEIDPSVKLLDELLQVASAPGDVLRRIGRPSHAKSRAGARHQLHQTARTFWRQRMGVEV